MIPQASASKRLDNMTGRGVTTTYLAGLVAEPAIDCTPATVAEDNTAGYARQQIVWAAPRVPTDEFAPLSDNASNIAFGPFTANGTDAWTHVALMEAASGTSGDVRYVWEMTEAFMPTVGETLSLPTGSVAMRSEG